MAPNKHLERFAEMGLFWTIYTEDKESIIFEQKVAQNENLGLMRAKDESSPRCNYSQVGEKKKKKNF